MVACLSPCDRDFEENLSTLTYAKLTTDVSINPALQQAKLLKANPGCMSETELLRLRNVELNTEVERLKKLIGE
jgi:hypothetical protein